MASNQIRKILVINTGSSSIKYQLFDMTDQQVLAHGLIERIGEAKSRLKHYNDAAGGEAQVQEIDIPNHEFGMRKVVQLLDAGEDGKPSSPVQGVGHRVVHGGEAFHGATLLGEKDIAAIESYIPLAPLHNAAHVIGIRAAEAHFPGVPQVAVFDTAYHQTIPAYAYRYAVPKQYYEDLRVRKYGFHGTSHQYVVREAAKHLGKPMSSINAISIHLGNGCSMAAIANGKSIDTSMGLAPLEGLIMGTRCGDVDAALHGYLLANKHESKLETIEDVDKMLVKGSGLKGLTGTNDMRDVLRMKAEGNEDAALAVDMYAYRIKKYIGSYYAVLGGKLDAIIFTAGVGENVSIIRELSLANMEALGIVVEAKENDVANQKDDPVVEFQADNSAVKLLVIPTNEELEIAMQTVQVLESTKLY
eukprot:scaffold2053_cov112-Cylindrotheca_fusiformis.AAC.6